jgi:hypothetical protein
MLVSFFGSTSDWDRDLMIGCVKCQVNAPVITLVLDHHIILLIPLLLQYSVDCRAMYSVHGFNDFVI